MAGGSPFARDIDALIDETLSPEAQSMAVAGLARDVLQQGISTNRAALGYEPSYDTFVDSRKGAPLESVKPNGGTIVFEFQLVTEVIEWIFEQLVLHSPRDTGRYAASHKFFVDSHEYDETRRWPPRWVEAVILNVQPYARKIERGESSQASDGVYQSGRDPRREEVRHIVRIRFSYRAHVDGSIMAYRAAAAFNSAMSRRGGVEREARVPAIVITPTGSSR
ncbi:MAG: hypothetical protein WDM84_08045 [Bauldia sp.]